MDILSFKEILVRALFSYESRITGVEDLKGPLRNIVLHTSTKSGPCAITFPHKMFVLFIYK